MVGIDLGNVIARVQNDVISLTDNSSCGTSQLSSLFASFLTGGSVAEMSFQKYFVLYKGDPITLRDDYEKSEGQLFAAPLIDRVDVHTSSTSKDSDGNYFATFVGTFQADNLARETYPDLSLALVAGNKILAFTSFDRNVYDKLCSGSRAEIKWKLQLKHVTKIIEMKSEETT